VDRTIKGLLEAGYKAGALHGDLPQVVRERVVRAFRKGMLDVLVCTDVAARGLDIAGLSHVINYDTPEDDRAYVHRIGRTGRAGAAGVAITFVAWNELETADLIRRRLNLTDEPVHEVYSTSPLLTELFELPTAEAAAAARGRSARPGPDQADGGDDPVPTAPAKTGQPARRSRRRRRRRISGADAQPAAAS
jgi:superfamily II DNA/RNA helicase